MSKANDVRLMRAKLEIIHGIIGEILDLTNAVAVIDPYYAEHVKTLLVMGDAVEFEYDTIGSHEKMLKVKDEIIDQVLKEAQQVIDDSTPKDKDKLQ